MHGYFETYAKFDPTFQFSGQWFAWWFDPQVVTNNSFNEIDGFENFCGNYDYPNSQISFSGHEWATDGTDTASGGGSMGTVSNGAWTPLVADGNWHRYGVLWVSVGTGTGYIEMFYDDQPIVTYDRFAAGLGGQIPTGTGGWPGFESLESGAPLFMMFGGPPGSDFLVDYARVICLHKYRRRDPQEHAIAPFSESWPHVTRGHPLLVTSFLRQHDGRPVVSQAASWRDERVRSTYTSSDLCSSAG